MGENRVKNRAREYLKENKKCKIIPKEVVWTPKNLEIQQKLDIVGIKKSGEIYVVECKAGKIGRPLQGIGQLTRYRVLIKKDFDTFKGRLEEWAEDDQELQKRISKSDESKLRYYLAVPKKRSGTWDKILKKCCKLLGFTQREYRDILLFRARCEERA